MPPVPGIRVLHLSAKSQLGARHLHTCCVGFTDGTLKVFQLLAKRLQVGEEMRFANLKKVVYAPTAGHLLAVVYGKFVALFDPLTMQKLAVLKKHQSPVIDCCFDFYSKTLATVSADGCFYLWDLLTYTRLAEYFLEPHKDFRGRGRRGTSSVDDEDGEEDL